jgi:hypothetical protein
MRHHRMNAVIFSCGGSGCNGVSRFELVFETRDHLQADGAPLTLCRAASANLIGVAWHHGLLIRTDHTACSTVLSTVPSG